MRKANTANINVAVNNTAVVKESASMLRALSKTVMSNAYSICNMKIASIPVQLLAIDESYQRPTNKKTVCNIMQDFNIYKCKFLWVSFRNDRYYVIDGQHRTEAAKAIGIEELPAIIFTGLKREDEALLFAGQNQNVTKLSPVATFKANLVNKDFSNPEVFRDYKINEICKTYNIEVQKVNRYTNMKTKVLRSLSAARSIVETSGTCCFEWIIKTICDTDWNDDPTAFSKDILYMMRSYYNETPTQYEKYTKAAKNVMQKYSPAEVIGKSKSEYANYANQTALNICFKMLAKEEMK